jgi:hypothetical protein
MAFGYVAYNKRSATTGRALHAALKAAKVAGLDWRFCNEEPPAKKASVLIRWGNSLLPTPAGVRETNTREAVRQAADKGAMARILSATEGVSFPQIIMITRGMRALPNGNWFVRNEHDQIRYRNTIEAGDKYAVREINKTREFRVHVFNDEIIGVYEKVPHRANDKILKAENCDFRRLDTASKAAMAGIKGVRPMAKAAVKALGLVHGGVDVIIDANNNSYVLEVNSSPALNEPNIERWVQAFAEYLGAPAPRREAPQAAAREERENERRLQEQRAERVRQRNEFIAQTRTNAERLGLTLNRFEVGE